ncbi:hypothetical protein TNCV_4423111 [Trichonephila clavipes]|nr:hypothetical protein TNCV_4423111 [Trichonephila clavipes]
MCEGDPLDTVHKSILSIDRDDRTLSEIRRGKRCTFNIVAFRIDYRAPSGHYAHPTYQASQVLLGSRRIMSRHYR